MTDYTNVGNTDVETKNLKNPPLNLSENNSDFNYDDRPAEMDELNFSDEVHTPSFRDITPDDMNEIENETQSDEINSAQLGLTEASNPGYGPTDDDLSPETLIHEDGARSPNERGGSIPTDQILTTRDEDEIGEGYGLDEAELARAKPLDGKPWDGPAN